ncbi:MAG: GNAT family N-acetyltransferase [Verrucomicrobia bacterium]|nr:GNAT family N-acetyltransferase [Verrucomicrobiota bacterium]
MNDSFHEFTIRAATNTDCASVQLLVFSVLREYGLTPEPHATDADLADIEANYFQTGGAFWVVQNAAGEIVGSVGLHPEGKGDCEMRKMYLASSVRGRGLGRKLLETAVMRARELGFRRVTLGTASVLKEAVRLYERAGFKPIACDHFPGRCDAAYALDLQ